MNNTNNYSARMSFDIAKDVLFMAWIRSFAGVDADSPIELALADTKACAACRKWVANRKLSQSEVRLEVELTATSNNFVFGVTPNQANSTGIIFPTEKRLTLQNSLIACEYGVFVGLAPNRQSTAWQLRTYGNRSDFSAAAANAIDQTFYSNGNYLVTVNNDIVAPYRGLFNHWYKPQTQQTAALGAGSPADQIRGAEDGFVTQEPNILLIGSKDYVPTIELKSNLAAVDTVADGASQRAIILYRGILAQNSTVIN